MQIIPFHADLIPEAATLLAQRHRLHRAVLPELPARFEDPAAAGEAVETAWRRTNASGVAALDNGQLLGYLIGEMVIDSVWGRSAWVRSAGLALGHSPEVVGDLYAALGARWVDCGCFAHFALLPTADRALLQAWFALSFGIEQVHALLALDGLDRPAPAMPPGLEIRRAGPGDRETLAELSNLIWRHQVQAPVWGIHLPESETREGWAELADDPTATVWLAFLQGRPAGCQVYLPAEPSPDDLFMPDHCTRLAVAGTREWARGRGVNLALTWQGLAQARADGRRFCETDWRSANLLASRFWPRRGFRPVAYRLVRRIDGRIAWARGEAGLNPGAAHPG